MAYKRPIRNTARDIDTDDGRYVNLKGGGLYCIVGCSTYDPKGMCMKFGISTDLQGRMNTYMTMNPSGLWVIATITVTPHQYANTRSYTLSKTKELSFQRSLNSFERYINARLTEAHAINILANLRARKKTEWWYTTPETAHRIFREAAHHFKQTNKEFRFEVDTYNNLKKEMDAARKKMESYGNMYTSELDWDLTNRFNAKADQIVARVRK